MFALVLLRHFPVRHFPVCHFPVLQIPTPFFDGSSFSTPANSSPVDEYNVTKTLKEKKHTHNSPAVPTYCIDVAIIIMQKKFCFSRVTLTNFYRHDCRISDSSVVSLTTNICTMHNLFFDTVIFTRNFHLRLAIVDSADKQLNICRHFLNNILRFSVKSFLSALLTAKSKDLSCDLRRGHASIPLGVTADALRAKIDRKSAISLQRDQFDPKFQVEGDIPTNHF